MTNTPMTETAHDEELANDTNKTQAPSSSFVEEIILKIPPLTIVYWWYVNFRVYVVLTSSNHKRNVLTPDATLYLAFVTQRKDDCHYFWRDVC